MSAEEATSNRRRVVRLLDLVDDAELIAAYEAHHRPGAVPADVIRHIREQGYDAMEIWRVADRLVMIAEVEPSFPRPVSSASQAAGARWEAKMDAYQRPVVPGPKWADAMQIFSLPPTL